MSNLYSVRIPELVPEGSQGVASVHHYEIGRKEAAFSAIRAMQHGPGELISEGKYARLMIGPTLMMSDTDMERSTNRIFVLKAKGNVLVAGLGLGLILFAIADKPQVEHVTVVEKYQDVVDLVGPAVKARLGDRLTIITADIFDWKPEKGVKFNTIYHDVWPTVNLDNLKEMTTLHRKFGRYLSPGGWQSSWRHQELQSRKRQRALY